MIFFNICLASVLQILSPLLWINSTFNLRQAYYRTHGFPLERVWSGASLFRHKLFPFVTDKRSYLWPICLWSLWKSRVGPDLPRDPRCSCGSYWQRRSRPFTRPIDTSRDLQLIQRRSWHTGSNGR